MDAIAEGGVPVRADFFRPPYHQRFFRLKVELSLDLRRPRGCLVTNSTAELASRDRAPATQVGGVLANLEAAPSCSSPCPGRRGNRSHSEPAGARPIPDQQCPGPLGDGQDRPHRGVLDDIVKLTLAGLE
jgi:hypothetical protein